MSKLKIEFTVGTDISSAVVEAIYIAKRINRKVYFDFNSIKLCVTKDSIPRDIESQYYVGHHNKVTPSFFKNLWKLLTCRNCGGY